MTVAERILRAMGLMNSASKEDVEETREVLLDFLSKHPETDEHSAAVEGLSFLKDLKT